MAPLGIRAEAVLRTAHAKGATPWGIAAVRANEEAGRGLSAAFRLFRWLFSIDKGRRLWQLAAEES
jgi:hypothetical protein